MRLLGRGAMGEVWLAEEVGPRNFTRQVALKRLLSTEGISDYARESFIAEAQVIARLDHPNIVRLIELGESDERGLYLVLDYIDGAALDRIMRKTGPLSNAAVAYVGREVARALDAVHTMCDAYGRNLGVVHRDVSPANILVGRDGRVRLSDFGVARIHGLGGEKTETGVFKGKLPYMPPEQARGEPFDGRADVFSLGVTLFEGLLGGRLRKAETQGQLIAKIATERVPRVVELLPGAMPGLAHAIDAATEFRSEQRIASAGHLAHAMQMALHALGPGSEEAALSELAERVAMVAGGAPASATRPWSLPLAATGENAAAAYAQGSNPSGPYFTRMAHAASGPYSPPIPLSVPSSPGGAPPSVPPEQGASVTRVASIADAKPRPASRAWPLPLALAALLGVGAGAFWVLYARPAVDAGIASSSQTPAAGQPGAAGTSPASSVATTAAPASATGSDEPTDEPAPDPSSSGSSKAPRTRPPIVRGSAAPTADPGPEATGPGTLLVTVSPWGNVTIDGRPYGPTPLGAISLPAGPHTVVVTNPDLGASRSATVRVQAGKQASIGFDLKKSQ